MNIDKANKKVTVSAPWKLKPVGKLLLPKLAPLDPNDMTYALFGKRARRLADLILLDAPPTIIAVDLWLTLVTHCGGRRRALWYGIRETWGRYVTLRWYAISKKGART